MQVLPWMLVTLVLAVNGVNGQNDGEVIAPEQAGFIVTQAVPTQLCNILSVRSLADAANSTDSGVGSNNNADTIVATSVVVSLVLVIVVALTITMW